MPHRTPRTIHDSGNYGRDIPMGGPPKPSLGDPESQQGIPAGGKSLGDALPAPVAVPGGNPATTNGYAPKAG